MTDPGRLLTALTTEHFTLAGQRAATTSESAARSSLFLGSVTSTLVALGILAAVSGGDSTLFRTFALTVLPTLCFLGVVTFVRLVQLGTEDFLYGRAINRIRNHYVELAGDDARLFMMRAHDDPRGVMENMGLRPHSSQLYMTNSFAIAVVTAVLAGATFALARFMKRHYGSAPMLDEPMFPTGS